LIERWEECELQLSQPQLEWSVFVGV
jgi:hypothetical protein